MIKYNYILNDLALSSLITKCLYNENANYSDKEELKNQIKLIQQESKQLKDNWNKLKKDIGYELLKIREPNEYNEGLCNAFNYINNKMRELERGVSDDNH